jgi:hypothetical protein
MLLNSAAAVGHMRAVVSTVYLLLTKGYKILDVLGSIASCKAASSAAVSHAARIAFVLRHCDSGALQCCSRQNSPRSSHNSKPW